MPAIRVPHRRPALVLSAALVIGVLAACDASRPERTGPDGANSGGPLRANLDGGGNALTAPGRRTWSGTFGSLLLCVDEGDDVRIDAVDYYYRVPPLTVRSVVREVPPATSRYGPGWKWAPVIANRATIDDLEGASFSASRLLPADGARIDVLCDDRVRAPYAELLTTVTVDSGGGWIDGIDVHYSVGGESFVLPVEWSYVACGDAIDDRWLCASRPRGDGPA